MTNSRRRLVAAVAAAGLTGSLILGAGAASAAQAAPNSNRTAGVTGSPAMPECTVLGTSHDDVLRGTSGDDIICAFSGDDTILGFGGNDVLAGGPGRDVLLGGSGRDRLWGGDGDDLLIDTNGTSAEYGDGGRDRCIGVQGSSFLECEHVIRPPHRG